MKRNFTKMHGCGNDYIYFLEQDGSVPQPEVISPILSRRRFGIGSDGIVILSPVEGADARMRIYNADGSRARMCGNALRCAGRLLYERGVCKEQQIRIMTDSGMRGVLLQTQQGEVTAVTADMGEYSTDPRSVPADFPGESAVERTLYVMGEEHTVTCVSMGNPHCVLFGGDPDSAPVEVLGPAIEHHPAFPERVNVEFARVIAPNRIQVRVWERGSGETMACGTGACAVAVAAVLSGRAAADRPVEVSFPGGMLTVRLEGCRVWLQGETQRVFDGTVEI